MRKRMGLAVFLIIGAGVLRAAAQEVPQQPPQFEMSAGYSYVRANQITTTGCCFRMNGGNSSAVVNLNSSFGLAAEVAGYHTGNVNNTGLDLNVVTYLFGPQLSYRGGGRLTPFGEVLLGGGHATGTLYSAAGTTSGYGSLNAFALATGGGIDVNLTPHVAVRLFQADYLLTRFRNGSNDHQNNLRLSAGVVFRFGGR